MAKTDLTLKPITTFTHADDTRKNIPTDEYQAMVEPQNNQMLDSPAKERTRV